MADGYYLSLHICSCPLTFFPPLRFQVLYGGTRNGVPVGGARYYLGPEFIET